MAQRVYRWGWVPATSGNFSARVEDGPGAFLVTATGQDKLSIRARSMVLVDADGSPLPGEPLRPSAETRIHARIYAAVGASAGAVLHAHPPHVVALSSVLPEGRRSIPLVGLELMKAFAGVSDPALPLELPVVANDQDMERTSQACAAALRAPVPAVAIAGHGVTVWGKDLDEAVRHLEAVESLAQVIVLQRALGRDPWRS